MNVVRLEKPAPEGAICFDHLRPEVEEVNLGIALELHRAERGVGLLDVLVEGVPRSVGGKNRGDDEFGPYQSPMEDGMQHFHEWYRRRMDTSS